MEKWSFPVIMCRRKLVKFEKLCKKFGYIPENYSGAGWLTVAVPSVEQLDKFDYICRKKKLFWYEV